MTFDISAFESSLTTTLNNVINDTFSNVFTVVEDQFSPLNGFDFTVLENNLTGAFTTLIDDIETFTQQLITDINNLLQSPIQDLLSVGSFLTFVTTVKLVILNNIGTLLKLRITYELAKPLIVATFETAKALYSLKDIPFQVAKIRFTTKFEEIQTRIKMRYTKFDIRNTVESFQNETGLKLNIAKFFTLPLIGLCAYLLFTIGETRNDISKHSL